MSADVARDSAQPDDPVQDEHSGPDFRRRARLSERRDDRIAKAAISHSKVRGIDQHCFMPRILCGSWGGARPLTDNDGRTVGAVPERGCVAALS